MLPDAKANVEKVLSPFSYENFFKEYVGIKPLVMLGGESLHRAKIAGDDPKADLLKDYKKYAATLTCHSNTPSIPPPVAHDVDNAEEFWQLIEEFHKLGYTVRIPEVTNFTPELSLFTRSLEKLIESPVGVVVFWSAPGAAAPVHYDEVDVIVIQLTGEKRWFISEDQPTLANKWKQAGEGPPPLERYKTVDVAPGDLLYLPRGTAHTVQSISESIHLSIGFVPLTVRDGMQAVLDHYSDLERSIRTSLGSRADDWSEEEMVSSVNVQIRQGLEKLLSLSQSDEFIKDAMIRRKSRMITDLPKHYNDSQADMLTANSIVEHHPLGMTQMVTTDHIIDLSIPGDQILIHKGVEHSLRFIVETPEFNLADIPGDLPDDVRVALVQKLIMTGCLQLKQ